jgi:hypothetical protein
MTTFLDPRVRMREALRDLIAQHPATWAEPSLFVMRNRLLDLTGSDARPLAEFLLEAWQRGWGERMPQAAMQSTQFDALVSPFVLQWSAERFVQPEMARWAVESWAYALGRIDEQQLRIAPPPRKEPPRVEPPAPPAPKRETRAPNATKASRVRATAAPAATLPAPAVVAATAPRTKQRSMFAAPAGRPASARPAAPYNSYSRYARSSVPQWIPRALFGTIVAMSLGLVVRVALGGPPPRPASTSASAQAPVAARVDSLADTTRAAYADTAARLVPLTLTGGVPIIAPERPGVPSITQGLLSVGADSTRMRFVQPARRATGGSVPAATPKAPPRMTFDELQLADGRSVRGQVEIVRAGTVIFRDMKTGLRVEYRQDDIDRVITEFGTVVRFRAERTAKATPSATSASPARKNTAPAARNLRSTGVGGSYRVRYATASAEGSDECTQIWTRPPNAEDVAEVRHRAGDDTLSVAFKGGDVFPSNIDPDGYFASSFRIVPDQARTMTALTTRLHGRFTADGALSLTVNIVYYRRLRGSEVTCNVTVKAEGKREG